MKTGTRFSKLAMTSAVALALIDTSAMEAAAGACKETSRDFAASSNVLRIDNKTDKDLTVKFYRGEISKDTKEGETMIIGSGESAVQDFDFKKNTKGHMQAISTVEAAGVGYLPPMQCYALIKNSTQDGGVAPKTKWESGSCTPTETKTFSFKVSCEKSFKDEVTTARWRTIFTFEGYDG